MMDRREFLKNSTAMAVAAAVPGIASAHTVSMDETTSVPTAEQTPDTKLITSAPVLQNYAETSMGVAFSVSDMANGYVRISERPDMADALTFKCGGYRVTDMNDKVMLVRLTGLKPATRYYYTIGADRISYKGGYAMKIVGNEEDPRIYSFATAGRAAVASFCVINDTHARFQGFNAMINKIAELAPSCVVWNGDATNCEETIERQIRIFLKPEIDKKDYASEIPYLFVPGNHDSRGMANRHLEKVWMYRQPEERRSRDWDLGRNFAVRMGEVAMIGLDTAEDKLDTNPLFAGLFNSHEYRKAQVAWLADALKSKEIASAPYLVAFCHIPLRDPRPGENPGDLAPADKAPGYESDYASWQRTCRDLWAPLLEKAGCQLVISAHQHEFRYDAPEGSRTWGQLVGGGPMLAEKDGATVIEGAVKGRSLSVKVHDLYSGNVVGDYTFKPRKRR